MPWSYRLLDAVQRADLIAQEATRRQMTRKDVQALALSDDGLDLPDGRKLIHDGRYYLLTPAVAR